MHNKWLNASIVVAALLAGAGAALFRGNPLRSPGEPVAAPADEFSVAHLRSAMVGCREAAQMAYDVHWAAACEAQAGQGSADGHAECDLPNSKAAVINAWLDDAERRCAAEGRSR
jgi:hypothetical protein